MKHVIDHLLDVDVIAAKKKAQSRSLFLSVGLALEIAALIWFWHHFGWEMVLGLLAFAWGMNMKNKYK